MPLVFDRPSIGFNEDLGEVELTAYMTDIQYLGVLSSVDEYASFFPASLNMDNVSYLSYQVRQYIAGLTEEKRMQYRTAAEAKLNLKEQFIWEAALNGNDYSDKIEIIPQGWTIYEATETTAPMIACRVKVKWVGEKPVKYEDASNDFSSLIGDGSTSGAGTKSVLDEPPEVQAFLKELYLEGGLTQENSPYYDLHLLGEDQSGATGNGTSGGSFNLMGSGSAEPTASPEPEASPAPEVSSEPEASPAPEVSPEPETSPAPEASPEPEASSEPETSPAPETSPEPEASPAPTGEDGESIEDNETPKAQAPAGDDAEPEASPAPESGEGDGADEEPHTIEEDLKSLGIPYALFSVRMKSMESITTGGYSVYVPSTKASTDPEDNNKDADTTETQDQTKTEDQTKADETGKADADEGQNTADPTADSQTTTNDNKANTTTDSQTQKPTESLSGNGNGQTTTNVATGQTARTAAAAAVPASPYTIRMTVGTGTAPSVVTLPASRFVGNVSSLSNIAAAGVLDDRVADCTVTNNTVTLTAKSEGRTKVYAWDNGGNFRVLNLEVTGRYTLSSQNAANPDIKFTVPMVRTYSNHTLALWADGTVSGWGVAGDGQLTHNNEGDARVYTPVQIFKDADEKIPLDNIVMVAVGDRHSLALDADGTVWAWGANGVGQVGSNSLEQSVPYPTKVVDENRNPLQNIVAIAAGANHSLALTKDGEVYAWGQNIRGQLGLGPTLGDANYTYAQKVAFPNSNVKIVQITAGGNFSVALSTEGTVWSWGENRGGQLGINMPSNTMSDTPRSVSESTGTGANRLYMVEIAAGGQSVSSGGDTVSNEGHVQAISVGQSGTTQVWGWGTNAHGEVGNQSAANIVLKPVVVEWAAAVNNVVSLAVGNGHTSAVTEDGKAYTWGYNYNHQLGHGGNPATSSSESGPTPGEVWGSQDSDYRMIRTMRELYGEVVGTTAGLDYTLFWFADGTVRGVGLADEGRLGSMEINSGRAPTSVLTGSSFSESLVFNKIWVYTVDIDPLTQKPTGNSSLSNRYASIPGLYNETDQNALKIAEKPLPIVQRRNEDGTVVSYPLLTITNNQYIVIFRDGVGRYYDVGFNLSERNRSHSYSEAGLTGIDLDYISENPQVVVRDTSGSTQQGDARFDPPAVNGLLNTEGTIRVQDPTVREQNGNLKYEGFFNVVVKDSDNFTDPFIKGSDDFTVALRADGTVWTWGSNAYGQLGIGKDETEVPMTTFPVQVSIGQLIEEIAVGRHHVLARTADGDIYAWGRNNRGQLGQGGDDRTDYNSPVQVKTWEGGSGDYFTGATSIAAGDEHSLAVSGGTAYAWGTNQKGQLGQKLTPEPTDATEYYSCTPIPVLGENDGNLIGVMKVYAGADQSFALSEDTTYSLGATTTTAS